MWLMPVIMWHKPNNLKTLGLIGIIAEFANSVFLLNGEGFINGTPFIAIMFIGILLCALIIEKNSKKRKLNCYIKKLKKYN